MARYNDNSGLGWKILSLFLTLILIAGVITGVVFWQKGNIQFIPVGQEQTEEKPEDNGAPVIDENGEDISSEETHAMPKVMTFRSATSLDGKAAAYDEVTIKATVLPETTERKEVDWAIKFKNPSSGWATAKTVTDYVTVTPTADGSTTATVKCLQPFGEPIEITVTSRVNDKAKATCTVDFAKRIDGIKVTFTPSSDEMNVPQNGVLTAESGKSSTIKADFAFQSKGLHEISYDLTYTDYTVNDTFSFSLTSALNQEYIDFIENRADLVFEIDDVEYCPAEEYVFSTTPIAIDTTVCIESSYFLYGYIVGLEAATDMPLDLYMTLMDILLNGFGTYHETFLFKFSGTYSNYTFALDMKFENIEIIAQDIVLDNENFVI